MSRQSIIKAVRPAFQTRAFSITTRTMAAGDTGSVRSGGVASADAFNKREKANEDYAIRMREKEKITELRKKVAEQQEHLKQLSDHIDELSKTSGGEQN
ncbi:mitochondrial ATPase inhibitor, IATP-domain-containing protein [Amylocarpus encephaloides]|uniref:ATPase inhibitor, mitochondrial n=1 Tax=Amylocarpus encephaloides TaxID=45428 RepID=A0A9P7YPW3_9HELO|nr:mitochondrial ATPase inhibitor, IATP-domain-containing protein [Amylocarpus encephaloides]